MLVGNMPVPILHFFALQAALSGLICPPKEDISSQNDSKRKKYGLQTGSKIRF